MPLAQKYLSAHVTPKLSSLNVADNLSSVGGSLESSRIGQFRNNNTYELEKQGDRLLAYSQVPIHGRNQHKIERRATNKSIELSPPVQYPGTVNMLGNDRSSKYRLPAKRFDQFNAAG